MPDKPLEQACDARVCIHTDQILDSCMDKDCVEDLRVYLTRESQAALDRSTGRQDPLRRAAVRARGGRAAGL